MGERLRWGAKDSDELVRAYNRDDKYRLNTDAGRTSPGCGVGCRRRPLPKKLTP
jgi:hypothetical protein